MKKRGLSGVIATLIMILLVLVSTGIVWVVIKNILNQGEEQISVGNVFIDMDVKSVKIKSDGSLDVRVKRNTGEGDISGIKIIISDGVKTETFDESLNSGELDVFEERTFNLVYDGLVKEVSVVPILKLESGKEKTGSVSGTYKFDNEEIIKNLGGVSWWRFEGNARDEIGSNSGTLQGGVDCSVQGKFGEGCEFYSDSDSVDIGTDKNLINGGNKATISAWIYLKGYAPSSQSPIFHERGGGGTSNYQVVLHSEDPDPYPTGALHFAFWEGGTNIQRVDTFNRVVELNIIPVGSLGN